MTRSTSIRSEARALRTDAELAWANDQIGRLLASGGPPPNPAAHRRLMRLTDLVEAYEEDRHPLPAPNPVEAILFRLEQLGKTRKDLEGVIGTRARVSEVLTGKRELSKEMIVRLHQVFGIPLESLLGIGDPSPRN